MNEMAIAMPDERLQWRMVGVMAVLALVLGGGLMWRFWEPRPAALPILRQTGSWSMIERDGSTVTDSSLRGRVWVADFIFTHCAGPCPQMTARMHDLYKTYDADGAVRFVSYSVDPERDTPEVLQKYAERYDIDDRRWLLLTGTDEQIRELAVQHFAVGSIDDPIYHSTKFALVDRLGRIRGYYEATEPDELAKLQTDLRKLLRERSGR